MKRESLKQRAERTYFAGLPGGLEAIALISRDAAASDRARRDVIAAAENIRTHGSLAFLMTVKAALKAEVSRENWPSHHAEEFTEGREALIDHVKRSYARLIRNTQVTGADESERLDDIDLMLRLLQGIVAE